MYRPSPNAESPLANREYPDPPRTSLGQPTTVLTIPRGIELRGELIANQALKIEGTIEGRINLQGHDLSIEPRGRVSADIRARSVVVRGHLDGNVDAEDKVVITARGKVRGEIRARRVVLADGSTFNGRINRDHVAPAVAKGSRAGSIDAVFIPRLATDESAPAKAETRKHTGLSLWTLVEANREH